MVIRTKIIATIGPASADIRILRQLAQAGCDVFRINFSHGRLEDHQAVLDAIRAVELESGDPLAVMADLCGPKIRVDAMAGGGAELVEGAVIIIQREPIEGTAQRISTTLGEIVDELRPGQPILLDDGRLRLEVLEGSRPGEVACRIIRGGMLSSGKGVNLPQTQLTLSALTPKDVSNVGWIGARQIDYVALSFVRQAQDVRQLRTLLQQAGSTARIIAKIEKPAALDNIEAIIEAADGIMVARGDLGVEMDLPAVPIAQKRIAALCQRWAKPCIIATQMLETMTTSPSPTRAEVSDVANAVLDCADAVMLSGETAVGKYPVAAVDMMNRIVGAVQSAPDASQSAACPTGLACTPAFAVAAAVREILRHEKIAAVAVYTATGASALMMAKNRLPCPILALSHDHLAMRRTCLYYGVKAFDAPQPHHTREVLELASKCAVQAGIAKVGDRIVVASGRPIGEPGHTNTIVIHRIGDSVA